MDTSAKTGYKSLVAVYGSLKQGFTNHRVIEGSTLVGTFESDPQYTMVDLGSFPAVTLGGSSSIYCEVYSVDMETLRKLYRLEGCDFNTGTGLYDAKDIETPFGAATIFIMESNKKYTNNRRVIDCGVWS